MVKKFISFLFWCGLARSQTQVLYGRLVNTAGIADHTLSFLTNRIQNLQNAGFVMWNVNTSSAQWCIS